MTIGIYILHWNNQDVYVGQSQNIESRFIEHENLLKKNNHTNYKLQRTYFHKGLPEMKIIQKCKLEELNELEIFWTKHFDSIRSGLNIVEAGNNASGVLARNSKYTKFQVLRVFSLLYKTDIPLKDIILKTNTGTLAYDLSKGNSHLWIKDEYPEQYKLMILKNRKSTSRIRKQSFVVIDPNGKSHTIVNGKEFCRINNLPYSNFIRILNGHRKQYKGWKISVGG